MALSKLLVYLCGTYALGFALFHVSFWKLLEWKTILQKVDQYNRATIQILNLRMIYVFLFVAFICFVFPDELLSTNMGKAFMISASLFWVGRLIEQFIFLNINHWKMHVLSILFAAGAILFILPFLVS